MGDLLCLGELLIDFVPEGQGLRLRDVPSFRRAPGGAPANVAVGFSRLGGKSAFIGKVGADEFGGFLRDTLERAGVDISHISTTSAAPTCLAFVSLRADGDHDFLFYGAPAAHMLLDPAEIDRTTIQQAAMLHFGSITLIHEPARAATLKAVRLAAELHRLISFDPNLRPALWPDLARAKAEIGNALRWVNLLKVSAEELEFITGGPGITEGIDQLLAKHPKLRLIAVTLGKDGCVLGLRKRRIPVAGLPVQVVDTTGAGDGFTAGLLFKLHRDLRGRSWAQMDWEGEADSPSWSEIGRFANTVGALVVTQRGAIPAMPDAEAVRRHMLSS